MSGMFDTNTINLSRVSENTPIEDENDDCTNMLASNHPIYNIIINSKKAILKFHLQLNSIAVKQVVLAIGASGVGKSTLMNALI